MKKLVALAFLLCTFVFPLRATTYYLATAAGGGNDANDGTSAATPWLTPKHSVNCGDVILAAPSQAYLATNFRPGMWGVVNCPSGNNVAWLKCATFDACKITINTSGHNAMTPTQSYWGVQGWEVTATYLPGNECFEAYPPDFTHTVHHIIFANNVANGCGDGAFATGASAANVGVDYLVILGNIAFNGAQDSTECYSGIDVVTPVNYDTLPGTHIYIAGNFAWGNVDPKPCAGGAPTDGQGINLDTVNKFNYSGQIVIDNNISVFNGGAGIQSFLNTGSSPNAAIYLRGNTTYGNQTGSVNAFPCAEARFESSLSSQAYLNLLVAGTALGCSSSQPIYPFAVTQPDSSDQVFNNFFYGSGGNNTTGSGQGFAYGSNVTGTNPAVANPVEPGPPSCSSYASVPACMATMIANFTPKNTSATAFGYQIPSSAASNDELFPQWLCTVTNLPVGLVTMGCTAKSSLPASPIITSIQVQ